MASRIAETWDVSASVQAQSAFRASGLSDPQRGFCRVDFRLVKHLPWWNGAQVGFVVENVFDNHYTDYRNNNIAQRVAWLTFSAKF